VSLALPDARLFTGIDWAAETHAVCVLDAAGKIVAEFTIEHSADGIASLIRRLARYGDPGDLPVAIERPDGRLAGPAAGGRAPGGAGQAERDKGLAGRRGGRTGPAPGPSSLTSSRRSAWSS
jgi:Transposase